MAEPPNPAKRIKPLARRLDSLSGSPTNSASRPMGLMPTGPRSGTQSPLELGVNGNSQFMKLDGSQSGQVKSEATVKDILAHARKKEVENSSKKETVGSGGRAPKGGRPVIHMDVGNSDRIGYSSAPATGLDSSGREGFVGRDDRDCCPMEVPFTNSTTHQSSIVENELVLFQIPSLLPTLIPDSRPTVAAPSPKKRGAPKQHSDHPKPPKQTGTLLADIPDGHLGTLKVHKSGKTYLEIGGVRFDVSAGQGVNFRNEVACLCPSEGELIFLGQATKRLVATPDIS